MQRFKAIMSRGLGPCGLVGVALLSVAPALAQSGQPAMFSHEEVCRRKFQEGVQYKNNQQLSQAEQSFVEVKEACPEMIDAYLHLGEAQVRLRKYLEAIDTYRDALDRDPGNLDVKEALAFALSSAGELEDALDLYIELNRERPGKPEILKNLAFVYQREGRVAEAIMLYNLLVEMDQADPRTVSEAGRLALDHKLFLPAVTFYKKLYEFDPRNTSTLHILAGYYFQIKFHKEAARYYDELLALPIEEGAELNYRKYRGYCRNRMGDYLGAAEDYRYLIEKEPDDISHLCNLAFALRDGGRLDESLVAVRGGLVKHPDAGCLHYAWGVVLSAQGDDLARQKRFEEAIARYQDAKGKFQRVVDLRDSLYGKSAGDQVSRMDQQVDRVAKMAEKEKLSSRP
ncbi:MAG: tetratricopeptide repeat protein [Candidatus Eisenbacteria bacterium]|uniref:Tetratricopeptide repeat protein n=1 Tax=Eiseniibacteriota bacterium TaxID=2212470 RepID=A0A938BRD4_UNCEI|nr:tetratricopeptide repeat protein [Candidatus Eisenbacteria bacterium]